MASKNSKRKGVENKPLYHAMVELRRSNAAVPQESRNKRLRTKDAILRAAKREY